MDIIEFLNSNGIIVGPINSNLKPKEYKRIPKKEKVSKITSCVPRNKKVSEGALKKPITYVK